MDRPKLEVADIFRRYGEAYRQQHDGSLSTAQRRVMTAIEVCRTAALGGHLERCDRCNYERPCYDSCGNRHCPKCQSLACAAWVEKRTAEVLPAHYFHVVFSVPEQIASIAYQNKAVVYGILFRATAETLTTIAAKCSALHLAANAVDIVMRSLVLGSPALRYCELFSLRIKDRAVKDAINLSLARNRPDLSVGAMTDSSTSSFIDGSARV